MLDIKRIHQHLIDVIDQDNLQFLEDLFGNVLGVLLVFLRANDGSDTAAMSSENLLLQASDRQYATAQSDLARHCDNTLHRDLQAR